MRSSIVRRAVLLAGLVVLAAGSAADAQAPPYPPAVPPPPVAAPPPLAGEARDIAACLCLRREVDARRADMAARRQAYDRANGELSVLDARLQHERATMDVNDPRAVARFSELLRRRDALARRATGPLFGSLSTAVARYNTDASRYNAGCANRPRDPVLVARVRARLVCPAPY